MEQDKDPMTVKSMMHKLYRDEYLDSYRVIVAGSRTFLDYDLMYGELVRLFWISLEYEDRDIKIISSMAGGADTLAIQYADERKYMKILFSVNWKQYHRKSWFLRKDDILSAVTHLVV